MLQETNNKRSNRKMSEQKSVGWLYRADSRPPYIHVLLYGSDTKTYSDTPEGAIEAARFLTNILGDSWSVDYTGLLGYRICAHHIRTTESSASNERGQRSLCCQSDPGAIRFNEYNGVVQCSACGVLYEPSPPIPESTTTTL
jgi:hypothetical protein